MEEEVEWEMSKTSEEQRVPKETGHPKGGSEKRTDQEKDQVGRLGIESILSLEGDIDTRRREKEVVIDALLIQEILASVKHYFDALIEEEEKQAITELVVEAIINYDLNYGEKAAIA
jgi:hypothetical protein